MSRSVLFLLLLLIIWIIVGAFLFNKKICNADATGALGPCEGTWSVEDGSFKAEADGYIKFLRSSDAAITTADINGLIDKTANYLKSNTNKAMTIIGYFDGDEAYQDKELVYLGLARANSVKALLTSKGVSETQLEVKPMKWKDEYDCFSDNTLNRGASFDFK